MKTSKTAGISVEIALSRLCEDGDIVTPVSPVDEKPRAGAAGICRKTSARRLTSLSSRPTHVRSLKRKGFQLYTINGELQVTRSVVMRVWQDMEEVRQNLGLSEPLTLPKTRAAFRSDRRYYREVLMPAQRDRIAKLFREEIELMGYED